MVALRAATYSLSVGAGVSPPREPAINISINQVAGFCIDLSEGNDHTVITSASSPSAPSAPAPMKTIAAIEDGEVIEDGDD